MAITLFYDFVITFSDAANVPHIQKVGHIDRSYRIVENLEHYWTISENEKLVVISDNQQMQLMHLLALLQHPPNPLIEPIFLGCDGIWISLTVNREHYQNSYRWWGNPPPDWEGLSKVTEYVMYLADIPRQSLVQRQRDIARDLFERITNRDLSGVLTYYHPNIQYRNPFFELQGAEVAALWQMLWRDLPDIQVVFQESGLRTSFVDWEAHYTYPPTGRYVKHHLSSTLTFTEHKVTMQVDQFNVHQWASSAYGFVGKVAGGWRVFEKQMAKEANKRLDSFLR